jgi:hypothetical protein
MEQVNYIRLISKLSNQYGDKLLELMDELHVNCLAKVTQEQAKKFYETRCKA